MSTTELKDAVSIAVAFLVPGTVINSPVFDSNGTPLLKAKTPLTKEIIDSLKQRGIERVFYLQSGRLTAKSYAIQGTIESGSILDKKIMVLAQDVFGEISTNVKEKAFIQTTGVHLLIEMIFKNLHPLEELPSEFLSPKPIDHGQLGHALHTAVIAMYLGLRHGFENTLIKQIGIGAFLHDLGGFDLTDKEDQGSEAEQAAWKKHPAIGFELIKLNGQLSGIVRKIILLHHETVDGTGYPLGVGEKDVGYYPYIVGLASSFDTMISEREFRKPIPFREALLKIVGMSGSVFPPYLVQLFVKHISRTQAGSSGYEPGQFVILSSREVARVIKANPASPDRPEVLVVRQADGSDADPAWRLNLVSDPVRSITKGISGNLQQQLEQRYPASE